MMAGSLPCHRRASDRNSDNRRMPFATFNQQLPMTTVRFAAGPFVWLVQLRLFPTPSCRLPTVSKLVSSMRNV